MLFEIINDWLRELSSAKAFNFFDCPKIPKGSKKVIISMNHPFRVGAKFIESR